DRAGRVQELRSRSGRDQLGQSDLVAGADAAVTGGHAVAAIAFDAQPFEGHGLTRLCGGDGGLELFERGDPRQRLRLRPTDFEAAKDLAEPAELRRRVGAPRWGHG